MGAGAVVDTAVAGGTAGTAEPEVRAKLSLSGWTD
jgi:hypothetical protein